MAKGGGSVVMGFDVPDRMIAPSSSSTQNVRISSFISVIFLDLYSVATSRRDRDAGRLTWIRIAIRIS
jgi:hypothetical protein